MKKDYIKRQDLEISRQIRDLRFNLALTNLEDKFEVFIIEKYLQ